MVKNKENSREVLKRDGQNSRGQKLIRDAKQLALTRYFKKEPGNQVCNMCKEPGALLLCEHCTRNYHLSCLQLTESQVPAGKWYCSHCLYPLHRPHMDKKFREELLKHLKSKKSQKDDSVKRLLNELTNNQKGQEIKKFAKKYPQYIRQGRIVYPIEDTLLLTNSAFHGVTPTPPRPRPHLLNIPGSIVGDLLYIADFMHAFKKPLGLAPFTLEHLYQSLLAKADFGLIREIMLALSSHIVDYMITREGNKEETYGNSLVLKLLDQIHELIPVAEYLPNCYLLLISEMMKAPLWKEYLEDNKILMKLLNGKFASLPLESFFYTHYDIEEKIQIIVFLINVMFECKLLHDELASRVEEKLALHKTKIELVNKIKELEAKSKDQKGANTRQAAVLQDKIAKLQNQLDDLNHDIEVLHVRNSPLGLDRDYNKYYLFTFDPNHIYVELCTPLDSTKKAKETDAGYWYVYSNKQEVEALAASLCTKGLRESKLFDKLKSAWNVLKLQENEIESTSSDATDELSVKDLIYNNPYSPFPEVDEGLEYLKLILVNIEDNFSSFLKQGYKQWEMQEYRDEWRIKVRDASSPKHLANLLLELANKANSPLRQTVIESSSESDEEDGEARKYRKVVIRIWQDVAEAYPLWIELVSTTETEQRLAFVIKTYAAILDNYIKKKPEARKAEQEPEKSKSKNDDLSRRSIRLEVRRKKRDDYNDHDDSCYFCNDGGELICCESCPRVVHPECIALTEIPEEDWYCDLCMKKRENTRQTRSKSRNTNT
jgi:hypothetical protein